jgi:uracil-DNA glycosylase
MKFNFLNFLNGEKNKPYFQKILKVINNKDKHIFPTQELLFNAFENFDYDNLKIVLLGQDPYHTKNVADSLAFSTQKNNLKTPASLKNIFKEIRNCYPDSKFLSNNLSS